MKHYVGLDVSQKETSMCILDEEGRTIFEESVFRTRCFGGIDPPPCSKCGTRIGFETGAMASWLWHVA